MCLWLYQKSLQRVQRAVTKRCTPTRTQHITATCLNVRSAEQQNPVGVIPVGERTPSVRERVRTADILVPTVFRMEPVPSAVTPVHTAIQKRCTVTKTYRRDITSTVMLQAVIPAAKP